MGDPQCCADALCRKSYLFFWLFLISISMSLNGIVEKAIAGRWIAGERMEDAFSAARRLNGKGISAMVNYLGEDFTSEKDVRESVKVYCSLMDSARAGGLRISVAVKPTQLGLRISEKLAARNYSALAARARKSGIFLWLDMESHGFVEATIRMYRKEAKRGGVGICIQSYLKRSFGDAAALARSGAAIRLVKGAYSEDESIAYRSRAQTTENYIRIMKLLFRESGRVMIATHDERVIGKALELRRRGRARVSFAMLNGIRNRYAFRLAGEGEDVSIYVPFGGRWVSYGYRRLKELGNSAIVLRSLLEPQS